MKSFRDSLQRVTLGVMFGVTAGIYFVGTYALALADGTSKLTVVDALIRLVGAAIFGALMTAFFAWRRRRNGGAVVFAQINRAISTGVVPEDAEPSVWVPALHARRRENERARWLTPLIFGLFILLGIWLLVQDPADVVSWVITAIFVAFAVVSVIQLPRVVKKIDVVLAQLESTPTGVPGGPQ